MSEISTGMKKFFVLSESVRNDSPGAIRYLAAADAERLKKVLKGAGLGVEEDGYRVRADGLRGGYAPRRISAYGPPEAFETNAADISRSLGIYYNEENLVRSNGSPVA
ncbi:MAG: hypothetical protein HY517_02130 [Candidatus Aenigmarchaeota archaeon]|nr:hypothetical protein [Candidatus Aenigmarchaeota archaeon]